LSRLEGNKKTSTKEIQMNTSSNLLVLVLVQSKTLIDAAKRNGVNHLVHLGAFTRERDNYTTVFAWHQTIEAYLRDSGVAWTNLRSNMFMQNLLAGWQVKGGLYSVYTSKRIGFTALEDVVEAAAVILMEGPERHSGVDYWFSANVLDPQQVAETLTAATGHKFIATARDHERFLKRNGAAAWFNVRTSVSKGRNRIVPRGRARKNGVHRKRSRRYKGRSGSRAIVAAQLGKTACQ
jgi:NAD(P)H dehydrogenase (quinone)